MAHKKEHVSTGNGFLVSNNKVRTQVITQAGKLNPEVLTDETLRVAEVTVSAADIIATGAGKFGHAHGVPVVADPGAGKYVDLVSGMLLYTRATASYTDGGNITFNENGGSALTGLVSNANSLQAGASVVAQFPPLSTAGRACTANKGVNIVSSAAFTNPGTAAGTFKARVYYRVHTL
jgi:hypothetical protein